ncbi:MAG: hypothetical protein ACYTGQ_03085 [Planctomycetota bacterium]|jgi:hypothetical protein
MDTQQLIEMITRQVLAATRDVSGQTGGVASAIPQAAINPPAGTCTGDYSMFLERPGETANGSNAAPAPVAAPLTGFITARALQEAGSPVVTLAPNARLTPAAQDYIKDKKIIIERANAGTSPATGERAAAAAPSGDWLWWTDGHCPAVKQITGDLRARLSKLPQAAKGSELANAVRQAAVRVREGRAAGVILFVNSASLAGCFANRCPSLRAVVGTCGQATCQGVNRLGANTLILEYPHHGYRAMSQMLDTFMNTPRPVLTEVDRQLQELARCV